MKKEETGRARRVDVIAMRHTLTQRIHDFPFTISSSQAHAMACCFPVHTPFGTYVHPVNFICQVKRESPRAQDDFAIVKHVINSVFHIPLLYPLYGLCLSFLVFIPCATCVRFWMVCRGDCSCPSLTPTVYFAWDSFVLFAEWRCLAHSCAVATTHSDIPTVCLSFLFSAVFGNDALRYWIHATLPSAHSKIHTSEHEHGKTGARCFQFANVQQSSAKQSSWASRQCVMCVCKFDSKWNSNFPSHRTFPPFHWK